jgi:hypothetical protein
LGHSTSASAAGRVDHALREGEQRLARAVHRQHLGGGSRAGQTVAARSQPAIDSRRASLPGGGGIIRQAVQSGGQRFLDEGRRRVLRLADRQA